MNSLPSELNLDVPEVYVSVYNSDDALFLNNVVRLASKMWSASQCAAILAAWRMKCLFEAHDSRDSAAATLGYHSWSSWLSAFDWPVSAAEIRTRVLDVDEYFRLGATLETVVGILSTAPTAGADVRTKILGRDRRVLPYIDESKLPGGSILGLLEAIAAAPNPGQARRLVSAVCGEPQIYTTNSVLSENTLHLTVVYERPAVNQTLFLRVKAYLEDGQPAEMPYHVASWLARKLGRGLE